MYVELITRISVVELKPGEGLLREALTSLYSLFDTTRKILRQHGPSIAQPKDKSDVSFGYLAIAILTPYILQPLKHTLTIVSPANRERLKSQRLLARYFAQSQTTHYQTQAQEPPQQMLRIRTTSANIAPHFFQSVSGRSGLTRATNTAIT